MPDRIRPPAHVEPYVNILGEEYAVAFLLAFGGAELYFKKNKDLRREVAKAVGEKGADDLAAAQAGLPRRVPTCKPYLARVLTAKGLTIAAIARKLHVADVTVRRYLQDDAPKRPPPEYDQPDLFE